MCEVGIFCIENRNACLSYLRIKSFVVLPSKNVYNGM